MQSRTRTWAAAIVLAAAWPIVLPGVSHAQTPTAIVVRVVSQDAKVIGSGVGGARVTIRDAKTGEVLAEGIQEGGTGDTERIMERPRERGTTVYGTPDAAAFRATLILTEPTRVEISAEGPLDYPHALERVSTTLLLFPGENVTGEGVVLVLYGFVVEILEVVPVARDSLKVRARVRMLCGCPTEPGGLWDSDRFVITARLVTDGEVVAETPLAYADEPSTYRGRLPVPTGKAALEVLAADPERVNFGMARRELGATSGS